MNQRQTFALLLTVPAVTVCWVAAVWFAGRGHGSSFSARLWIPEHPKEELLARSLVVTFPEGSSVNRSLNLELRLLRSAAPIVRLKGQCDATGQLDWALPLAEPVFGARVQLWHEGDEAPLVEGELEPAGQGLPALEVAHGPTVVQLRPSGPSVALTLGRGAFSLPLEDELVMDWPKESALATLDVELSGAVADGGRSILSFERGSGYSVRPTEHVVEVSLRHQPSDGGESRGFAVLPVVPGAIGVVPEPSGEVRVVSPVPRPEAYLVFATVNRVLALARAELSRRQFATGAVAFEGRVSLPERVRQAMAQEAVWLVTSSEWDMMSEAQAGWPLGASSHVTTRFRWRVRYDGAAALRRRAEAARGRLRELAWLGITVACLLEVALVVMHAKRDRDQLLGAQLATTTVRLPWLAIACIVLGFGGLAAMFVLW